MEKFWYQPSVVVLSNGRNQLIIVLGKLDLLEVGLDTLFLDTLGDDRVSSVGAPCNKDLSRGSIESLGNFNDFGVISEFGFADDCKQSINRVKIEGSKTHARLLPKGL